MCIARTYNYILCTVLSKITMLIISVGDSTTSKLSSHSKGDPREGSRQHTSVACLKRHLGSSVLRIMEIPEEILEKGDPREGSRQHTSVACLKRHLGSSVLRIMEILDEILEKGDPREGSRQHTSVACLKRHLGSSVLQIMEIP